MKYLLAIIIILSSTSCSLIDNELPSRMQIYEISNFLVDSSGTRLPLKISISSEDENAKPGNLEKIFYASEFPDAYDTEFSFSFSIPTTGKLYATLSVLDANGNPLFDRTMWYDLSADMDLSLMAGISKSNPTLGCFGCGGSTATSLKGLNGFTDADSLFFVWNSWSLSQGPPIY